MVMVVLGSQVYTSRRRKAHRICQFQWRSLCRMLHCLWKYCRARDRIHVPIQVESTLHKSF